MKNWCSLLLALVLCCGLVSAPALATGTDGSGEKPLEGNATVDFVLVLDCSGSLAQTDPYYLCSTACEMFLDMVPLENARISIMAFGYPGGEGYTLTGRTVENPKDLKKVHVLSPLEEASAVKIKDGLKDAVNTAVRTAGDKTPIGTATMAAVDLLEANQAADGNACIILLTDGGITADQSWVTDKNNAAVAADAAGEHQWPIYTMQLNDGNRNDDNSSETALMKDISVRSGAENGHRQLTNFSMGNTEITAAFQGIFNRFLFGQESDVKTEVADANGVVESVVTVPNLTSESTIVVSGSNLKKVDVLDPSGSSRTIDKAVADKKIVATVKEGYYICVKVICPEPGDWTIRVYGDPNATISMYECSMKDLDLVLTADVSDANKVFKKSESITLSAHFAYHGTAVRLNEYYSQKAPSIVATNTATGKKAEIAQMQSAEGVGYTVTLPVRELSVGAGAISLEARLDDTMFRNGAKYSNKVAITTENLPLQLTRTDVSNMKGYVFGTFEPIDLQEYVSNPDGDQLFVDVVCLDDRTRTFKASVDAAGYLAIECGAQTGKFQVQMGVKDQDMDQYLMLDPFTVTVEDRKFSYDDVPEVELWIDSFGFQKDKKLSATVDLAANYNDPDGNAPVFSQPAFEGMGTAYNCTQEGSVLELTPLAKGKGTITFTVTDGITTTEETIRVSVISGRGVFFGQIGIYVLIVLIVLAVILLILLIISKNTRVKGTWMMTLQDASGRTATWSDWLKLTTTKIGKKKKFTLSDLFNATNNMGLFSHMESDPDVLNEASNVLLTGEAKNIVLKGVVSGKGCQLLNVPSTTLVSVSCNGMPVQKKKAKLTSGAMMLTMTQPGEETGYTLILEVR